MSRRIISQREARRLQKRVAALEAQESARFNQWSRDYPGGVHFWTLSVTTDTTAAVKTARSLGHAVVATLDNQSLRLFALPERRANG